MKVIAFSLSPKLKNKELTKEICAKIKLINSKQSIESDLERDLGILGIFVLLFGHIYIFPVWSSFL